MNVEQLGTLSIDELVLATKAKKGAASALSGFTRPEGWPLALVLAVGSPGNEAGVAWVQELQAHLASESARAERANVRSDEVSWLRWLTSTLHLALHAGAVLECQQPVCLALFEVIERLVPHSTPEVPR